MKLFSTVQFPGDLGKHSDPKGQECLGRVFTVKQVGVGGVYINHVTCAACNRELAATEERLLPVHSMTTWHIKKTGEDEYHVHGGDQFTRIEENMDGSKLMGMLTGKALSPTQIDEIVGSLDSQQVGFQTTIAFNPA